MKKTITTFMLLGILLLSGCAALAPAPTETPMLPTFHEQVGKEFMNQHFQAPIGRDATPEEMAEPLLFLGSDMARFVSGHNLFVDYGYVGSIQVGDRQGLL